MTPNPPGPLPALTLHIVAAPVYLQCLANNHWIRVAMEDPSPGVDTLLQVMHCTKPHSFPLAHLMLLLNPILHFIPQPPTNFYHLALHML